jgi:biotin synthase
MLQRKLVEIASRVLDGKGELQLDEAWSLTQIEGEQLYDLFFLANRIRAHFMGKKVELCSIINAKCGRCPEDCKFCAQSIHHSTQIDTFPLLSEEKICEGARLAQKMKAKRYGIVTSGRAVNAKELKTICKAIKRIKAEGHVYPCASLGRLTEEHALQLKEAGLTRYHHNLEVDEEFFPMICTTHSFSERVETVRVAKRVGFEVCCGGIFGVGESWRSRIGLAFKLKELEVNSIPLNFLNPIKGTPLENTPPLKPLEILKIIAIFRFIHPKREIKVCGGREVNLRDMQSWMYYAGASGTLIGNYLTTPGRDAEEDLQMLRDINLTPASPLS